MGRLEGLSLVPGGIRAQAAQVPPGLLVGTFAPRHPIASGADGIQAARTYKTEDEIRRGATDFETWRDLYNAGFPTYEGPELADLVLGGSHTLKDAYDEARGTGVR
jgi:hypothetical protein